MNYKQHDIEQLSPDHDFDLLPFRSDIRRKRDFYISIAISARNSLCSVSIEDKCKGMKTLFNLVKSDKFTIDHKFLQAFQFYVLLHFYIHQIHCNNPNYEYLNYAIFLLQFPQIIDINDVPRFKKDNIQFPYKTTENVQSLIQQDSIQFLLNGIRNNLISESCFDLLTMIFRKKEDQIYLLNETFFNFIRESPNSTYGEIIYLFFEYCLKNPEALQTNLQFFKNIFINILNCSNQTNILFMLKSMNEIVTNQQLSEILAPSFQEPYKLLITKLPQFISINFNKITVQSLIFVSTLNEISDPTLLSIFHCLPTEFKKMHNFAFFLVASNLNRITSLIEPYEIAEIIQSCFQSSQNKVKINAHILLIQFMNLIPIIDYIDIETLFPFLDDPSMASMVLPTIIASISAYEKNGNTQALLEALSNNINQITELVDNEDENVAQMANSINSLFESLTGN